MRQRPFFTVAAAVMVFAAALTTALRASAPAATAVPPTGSGLSRAVASESNYVGPGSCSAVACHGVTRTENCHCCNLGTSEKFVDHEMIAAAHPDLVFELEQFSAAMPRHWIEKTDTDAGKPVRTFAVGQLVHLRASLDSLARHVKSPVWPEYAALDCFACHHGLTRAEDSWRQAQGYEHRARPGLPHLQMSRYLTAPP